MGSIRNYVNHQSSIINIVKGGKMGRTRWRIDSAGP